MMDLYFSDLLSFAFIIPDEQLSYWETSSSPTKSLCSLSCTGCLKREQLIKEKLLAKEKDLLVALFLFCQFLLDC